MCLAVPGKIIEIKNNLATVDYGTEKREGKIVEGNFSVGDYVIIQGKIVIEKIPEQEVKQWFNLFRDEKKC